MLLISNRKFLPSWHSKSCCSQWSIYEAAEWPAQAQIFLLHQRSEKYEDFWRQKYLFSEDMVRDKRVTDKFEPKTKKIRLSHWFQYASPHMGIHDRVFSHIKLHIYIYIYVHVYNIYIIYKTRKNITKFEDI